MAGSTARVLNARLDGVSAARAGKAPSECPFKVDSADAVEDAQAKAWTAGYARASRSLRGKAPASA